MARISISESSRKASAIWPSSVAAPEKGRPPNIGCLGASESGSIGALKEGFDEVGHVRRGFSYSPKASSSTMHMLEKLMRLWL